MKTQALYFKNNRLFVLDQLLLPQSVKYIGCNTVFDAARVIKNMNVRGAPAIGIAAAYGFALAFKNKKFNSLGELKAYAGYVVKTLSSTRPTAVNLLWACEKMRVNLFEIYSPRKDMFKELCGEARDIHSEDILNNKKMSDLGEKLLPQNSNVITHCNAGALATGGYGTALGVIYSAHKKGKIKMVYADETRPYLQGARLTAWELMRNKVACTLITDNMAGHLMKTKKIQACIIGADRVAGNGDTANKIGSYALAILAKYHKVPFYVVCPFSTFDTAIKSGAQIPIEERSSDEVVKIKNIRIAPLNCKAWHPAFDITPAELISAIITERGIIKPPFESGILKIT